jgi:hypothetical protein
MDPKFQALLVETLSGHQADGRVNASYHAQITRNGSMFFKAGVDYYGIGADVLAILRASVRAEIFDRLERARYGFQQIKENDPNVQVYQWDTLDLRAVFKFEDGLSDVMSQMLKYGKGRAKMRGDKVDD